MKRVIFRKPFIFSKELEDFNLGIVTVVKISYKEIVKTIGNTTVSFPIQYKYYIQIDLWFIIFNFSWLGSVFKVPKVTEMTNSNSDKDDRYVLDIFRNGFELVYTKDEK